ncbi:hypothetical protein AB1Y20_020519 [Prymnesium parvum]|uniref:Centrosomal protein of 162 kDa n=1 Tax=Prymnesium parvum TaxID=97485 RepID=A0AB34JZK4_PRYPA
MRDYVRNRNELWRRGSPDRDAVAPRPASSPLAPPVSVLDATIAATRLQKAGRAMLQRSIRRQHANVSAMLAAKRRDLREAASRRAHPPERATPPPPSAMPAIRAWGSSQPSPKEEQETQLERRLHDLQRVVESEQRRLASPATGETQGFVDVDALLEGAGATRNGGQPVWAVALRSAELRARSRRWSEAQSGAVRRDMPRSSLDEFRRLEEECNKQMVVDEMESEQSRHTDEAVVAVHAEAEEERTSRQIGMKAGREEVEMEMGEMDMGRQEALAAVQQLNSPWSASERGRNALASADAAMGSVAGMVPYPRKPLETSPLSRGDEDASSQCSSQAASARSSQNHESPALTRLVLVLQVASSTNSTASSRRSAYTSLQTSTHGAMCASSQDRLSSLLKYLDNAENEAVSQAATQLLPLGLETEARAAVADSPYAGHLSAHSRATSTSDAGRESGAKRSGDSYVLSRTALAHSPGILTPSPAKNVACFAAERAAEMAGTVYAGVKMKMGAMKSELQALRVGNAQLRQELRLAEDNASCVIAEAAVAADTKVAQEKEQAEASIARHLSFIDRLLADKQELSKQCEGLTAQLRALEDKFVAAEVKREEAYAKELRRQKELWAKAERTKREEWAVEKTKEIKESTVRGLEPEIQRLVARHKDEARRVEEAAREESRRELAAERARAQREAARMNEAAVAERQVVQERERELCQRRLAEMSAHFEEQLHAQRLRQSSQAEAEREVEGERRRRELSRLEDELREVRAREGESVARARAEAAKAAKQQQQEHAAELEEVRGAHVAAQREWEGTFDERLASKLAAERALLEGAMETRRTREIEMVVSKLGAEMAAAERAAEQRLERELAQCRAACLKDNKAQLEELEELKVKYVRLMEARGDLEGRVGQSACEISAERARADEAERDASATRGLLEKAQAELQALSSRAAAAAEVQSARWEGERAALAEEAAQLRAELRAAHAAQAVQLSEARQHQDEELRQVEERVRLLRLKKDETISALQRQLANAHSQLLESQEQLRSVQREVLGME